MFFLLLRFNLGKLHLTVNMTFPKQAFPNPIFQIVHLMISCSSKLLFKKYVKSVVVSCHFIYLLSVAQTMLWVYNDRD